MLIFTFGPWHVNIQDCFKFPSPHIDWKKQKHTSSRASESKLFQCHVIVWHHRPISLKYLSQDVLLLSYSSVIILQHRDKMELQLTLSKSFCSLWLFSSLSLSRSCWALSCFSSCFFLDSAMVLPKTKSALNSFHLLHKTLLFKIGIRHLKLFYLI